MAGADRAVPQHQTGSTGQRFPALRIEWNRGEEVERAGNLIDADAGFLPCLAVMLSIEAADVEAGFARFGHPGLCFEASAIGVDKKILSIEEQEVCASQFAHLGCKAHESFKSGCRIIVAGFPESGKQDQKGQFGIGVTNGFTDKFACIGACLKV